MRGPPAAPYRCHNSSSYRERRRARRLALATAAAATAGTAGGGAWQHSSARSSAGCSSSDDGIAAAVGGTLFYAQAQQQFHRSPGGFRRGACEGGRGCGVTNFDEENSRSLRMEMALGLGFGPRYGDDQTADVILNLKRASVVDPVCEGGEKGSLGDDGVAGVEMMPVLPLYLHSKALRRSEFFEARLSERWRSGAQMGCNSGSGAASCSSDNLSTGIVELTLDNCKDPQTYVRCIQLLYVSDRVKHTCFTSVEDALNILEVAAELLFHDCVTSCMRYLESVPWTPDNENAIRSCVTNLHLQPSEDLAARLCSPKSVPDVKPVDIMQGVLGELLTLVTTGAPSKARDITERVLLANVQPASSPAFATVNEVALFKEFTANLEILKVQLRKFANFFSWNGHQVNVACSALRWLLDELFTLQIADEAIRMFSEEKELAQLMVTRIYQNPFTETLFFVLVRMLHALQRGDVLSPRPVRLALLVTWLPVIAKLGNDDDSFAHDETQRGMEEGLGAVVETLPMVDQELIFRIWIAACLKCRRAWPDLSDAFESWCSKLRQAHRDASFERTSSCTESFCPTKA